MRGHPMRKKKLLAVVACLVAAGAATAYWFLPTAPKAPDPQTQPKEETVKFLASKEFSKLPEKEREEYFSKLVEARRNDQSDSPGLWSEMRKLPEAERETLQANIRPLFEARMTKEAEEYFALPDEKKMEHLDKIIDRMQERFAQHQERVEQQGGNQQGGGRPDGQRRGPSAQRVKQRIETTSPHNQALMAEFRKDLHDRMKERGIEPPHRR